MSPSDTGEATENLMNEPVLAVTLLLSAAVLFGVWRLLRATRWMQMRRTAASLGLEVVRSSDLPGRDALLALAPFAAGDGVRATAYRGRSGSAELVLFELESRGHAPDPVAMVDLSEGSTRPREAEFVLSPRAAGQEGLSVSFVHGSRFDELYCLRGPDETALRTRFGEPVLGFFERAENLGWVLACDGGWLAISVWPLGERRRRLEPKHLAGFVEDARLVHRVLQGAPPTPSVRRRHS